jgi:hypothetical protein
MSKTFQVVALDPQYKLAAYDNREPIAEFDDFCEAETLCYTWYKATALPVAVWNTKSQGFQSYYRPKRNKLGQFQ